MVKIEAETLEGAYSLAAEKLSCSITQLDIEVIQVPKSGFMGLFKKQAIIVATSNVTVDQSRPSVHEQSKAEPRRTEPKEEVLATKEEMPAVKPEPKRKANESTQKRAVQGKKPQKEFSSHNDIILPASFVTDQEEDDYDGSDLYPEEDEELYIGAETEICDTPHDEIHAQLAGVSRPASKVNDNFFEESCKPSDVAMEIKVKIDALFKNICFEIDEIKVCEHDEKTVLIEFTGKDAALLIGKEGYRYKALSYMLYNWINATYQLQLRLEIAEFLKNQEEMICKYLEGVYTNINRDGRAQTKILDGVLVQIALRELRAAYPDKYVAIRSTRDGAKFIIINSFNNDSH
jgi:spoIIIJ-associated protein